jgi:NAD(P)-dependent dehydrogenase (short-subunit alcohol dehydrogenase family)
MTRIQGRLALITGGNHGIGLRIAERLAALGAHVVLWARRRKPLEEGRTQNFRGRRSIQP